MTEGVLGDSLDQNGAAVVEHVAHEERYRARHACGLRADLRAEMQRCPEGMGHRILAVRVTGQIQSRSEAHGVPLDAHHAELFAVQAQRERELAVLSNGPCRHATVPSDWLELDHAHVVCVAGHKVLRYDRPSAVQGEFSDAGPRRFESGRDHVVW